ncbi:MAG: M20 family metallopeptidase, partial [Saprospiraceae bacterium]
MENKALLQKIQEIASQIFKDIQSFRHHIHAHPELSFQEKETSSFICSILDKHGITYTTGWAGFGIVAEIKGKIPGKTLGLRADMDALPILEKNQVPYVSKNEGVMHACGHDVHSSCLLGAAIILQEMKDYIQGNIILLFQPGEEKLPGGAGMMIKEGVLNKYAIDAVIAQHVYPSMEVGRIGVKSGLYMASADEIFLTVVGKGGHAAMPQDCVDTLLMAGQILVNLQQIVSRKAHPAIPTVLSFGKINSEGGATNVIPDRVQIEGTFRTMDETWRAQAHTLIQKICSDTAATFGGSCEVRIEVGYPCLINDPILTEGLRSDAKQYLGTEMVEELTLRMTSEDFSFFSQYLPTSFYRLGTGNKTKGISSPVHTPT